MCRWCPHRGNREALEAEQARLKAEYADRIAADPKGMQLTIEQAIRAAKAEQKAVRRRGESSAVIDYLRECLSFAAMLINNGWTNGGRYFI